MRVLKSPDVDSVTLDRIRYLRCHCKSIRDIAKDVGRSDKTVARVLDCEGWREYGVGEIVKLRRAGLSIKEIARAMRLSDHLVSKVVKRHCSQATGR